MQGPLQSEPESPYSLATDGASSPLSLDSVFEVRNLGLGANTHPQKRPVSPTCDRVLWLLASPIKWIVRTDSGQVTGISRPLGKLKGRLFFLQKIEVNNLDRKMYVLR